MQTEFLSTLISVLFFIVIGYGGKSIGVFTEDMAKKIIKFLFLIPLPVLVFSTFLNSEIRREYFYFPLISLIITVTLMGVSYLVGKALGYSDKTIGTLIVASGITSTLLFALPFVEAFYDTGDLKFLFLYDLGNGIMAWTVVYFIAGRFGNKRSMSIWQNLIKLAKTPMLFALVFGILLSSFNVQMPEVLVPLIGKLSAFANPLLLICIGAILSFSFFKNKANLAKISISTAIIMGLSFLLALGLSTLFGITGEGQEIVLLCALAPAAGLTVVFSVEHDLDTEFAAAIVPFTMVLGLIITPIFLALV